MTDTTYIHHNQNHKAPRAPPPTLLPHQSHLGTSRDLETRNIAAEKQRLDPEQGNANAALPRHLASPVGEAPHEEGNEARIVTSGHGFLLITDVGEVESASVATQGDHGAEVPELERIATNHHGAWVIGIGGLIERPGEELTLDAGDLSEGSHGLVLADRAVSEREDTAVLDQVDRAEEVVDEHAAGGAALADVVVLDELDLGETGAPYQHADVKGGTVAEVGLGRVTALESLDGGTKTHIDVAVAEDTLDPVHDVLVEGAEQVRSGLDKGNLDELLEVAEGLGDITNNEVVELTNELAGGGAAADDDEGQQTVTLDEVVVVVSDLGELEAFEDTVADETSVVQVLEEEDLLALALSDTGGVEGVGLAADSENQVVVVDGGAVALEHILEFDGAVVSVPGSCLGLVVVDVTRQLADGLLNDAELERADGSGREEGGEEEVVGRGDHSDVVLALVNILEEIVSSCGWHSGDGWFRGFFVQRERSVRKFMVCCAKERRETSECTASFCAIIPRLTSVAKGRVVYPIQSQERPRGASWSWSWRQQ